MQKRLALLLFAATMSSIAVPNAAFADGVPELRYLQGTWICATTLDSTLVQQFMANGPALQMGNDVYRQGEYGSLTVELSLPQGRFRGESRGWENDVLAFTGNTEGPQGKSSEQRLTYQRFSNDRFTRTIERKDGDNWHITSLWGCERLAAGERPSQHVIRNWFSGPLDSLVGKWACGAYSILGRRIAHVVNLEHLSSSGNVVTRSTFDLDDTDPAHIQARGFIDNWDFAAITPGNASGGWTFVGPGENGSNETSFKLVLQQTQANKFDETVQWLRATSSTDPGTWVTILSGSCRRLE